VQVASDSDNNNNNDKWIVALAISAKRSEALKVKFELYTIPIDNISSDNSVMA
jgi:hypothetical protein